MTVLSFVTSAQAFAQANSAKVTIQMFLMSMRPSSCIKFVVILFFITKLTVLQDFPFRVSNGTSCRLARRALPSVFALSPSVSSIENLCRVLYHISTATSSSSCVRPAMMFMHVSDHGQTILRPWSKARSTLVKCSSLHEVGHLPTRGWRSPYTDNSSSLHGGFDFPARSGRCPPTG